jgi:hypothetical protein
MTSSRHNELETHDARTIDIPCAAANFRCTLLYEAFDLLVLINAADLVDFHPRIT